MQNHLDISANTSVIPSCRARAPLLKVRIQEQFPIRFITEVPDISDNRRHLCITKHPKFGLAGSTVLGIQAASLD